MNWFFSALITGAIAFPATNLDDILFLTIFFSQTRQRWRVVLGQYLGFSVLVLISLIGFFSSRILPHDWIRLLGVATIAIGIKKLLVRHDESLKPSRPGIFNVALITFVNGADNIGVYTPLFAVSDLSRVLVLIGVLYVLLAVWCAVGYIIHRQQVVAATLNRYGHWLVPIILIGLGCYILIA
jgi:cadmium resistance protein CadD (predicted permease)